MLLMTAAVAMPMPTEKAFDVDRPASSKKYVEYPITKPSTTSCEVVKTPMAMQDWDGQSITLLKDPLNIYRSPPEIHSRKQYR